MYQKGRCNHLPDNEGRDVTLDFVMLSSFRAVS